MNSIQQFVFGYGSLICPHSRAITAPTLAERTVTPVLVRHVERTWAKAVPSVGFTAMGVRFADDAECVGVLVPVNDRELSQFDARERGYNRVPLYINDVEPVPFLDSNKYEKDPFWQAKAMTQDQSSIRIWMYMQQNLAPPSEDTPIVQSYVDTILRGCLTISEDFAEQFIANTKGWHPNEISDDEEDDEEEDMDIGSDEEQSTENDNSSLSDEDVFWVDDRHDPIYPRGDQKFMLKNKKKLDSLLKRHREEFQFRTTLSQQ
ncbi:expressed unknown protein [Seminavis robusta]|uniref:Gamma-glutamylcyclotransferase AIG2-like domain-containing protein n=1 Tax=Seminavis robusta TaxID=568900 RepID=A0A9N8EYV8_9STRA|nr:expressed unknown protein [Seminavis robusta]|eukprot:Sro2340_g324040.1 n/a (262) ;mRNA; f:12321-13106